MDNRKTINAEMLALFVLLSFAFVDAAAAQDAQPDCKAVSDRLILVSLADRQLAVIDDGDVIARFDVAVGAADSPSPVGQFRIVNRISNPTYYHPGMVIPSGKNSPIGGWGSVRKAMAFMERMRRDRLDTRHRMDASGCAIATWSGCSRCCESAMWWRSTGSATNRLHEFSAIRQTRRWSRMRRLRRRRAGNNK